jgi:hypothetical protein
LAASNKPAFQNGITLDKTPGRNRPEIARNNKWNNAFTMPVWQGKSCRLKTPHTSSRA